MKRRVVSWLMAVCMLVLAMAPTGIVLAEDLYFPEIELEVGKKDEETRGEGDELDNLNNANQGAIGSLAQKDWAAAAAAVSKTGDWRDDLVHMAESQVGYAEASDGMTIYHDEKAQEDWTALFVNWAADQAGLTAKQFPRGNSYAALRSAMDKVHALKKISRTAYPTSGDLLMIDTGSQQLVGIVVYVSNGYATVIHGDDNGKVTRSTVQLMTSSVRYYVDLNVLMERAGIEVGKGGEVPVIPEGGVAAWTNTNAVYMRSEPTTASKSLTTIKKANTAVLVTSAEMQGDGYIWYGVTYKNYEGFIRGDLLNLDLSAIPTATPAPTATPVPAPTEEPAQGCVICVNEADGVALPAECCYEHLAALGKEESYRFMSSLLENDYLTFMLYVNCHNAHIASGETAVICTGCEQSILAPVAPGAAHSEGCGWYVAPALDIQERVVNIVVHQPANADGVLPGQAVTFTYEVVGAAAYQWYQVETAEDGESIITLLPGENHTTLTVTANENTDGISYYCEAIVGEGASAFTVTSKPVTLAMASVIEAKAIIGEEVYFTYTYEGAVAYQWFVREPGAVEFVKLEGAAIPRLSLIAELEMSGVQYFCAAYDANGVELAKGNIYTYSIDTDDISKYVQELAGMTRDERYAIMTGAWNVTLEGANYKLADLINARWQADHMEEYPTLLCTCTSMISPDGAHGPHCPWLDPTTTVKTERANADPCDAYKDKLPAEMLCAYEFLRVMDAMERYEYLAKLHAQDVNAYGAVITAHGAHVNAGDAAILCTCLKGNLSANHKMFDAPGAAHEAACPWSINCMTAERADRDADFAAWVKTATEEMIIRALTVDTLDHIVLEKNEDGVTYTVYVARYAAPVGAVDAQGYMTYGNPALVIAWVDLTTGTIHGVKEVPATAPAYVD
ncbi:MAG: hypothetical protein E7318_03370 [Clostridiales bacterium]|nr:hypothetical protein [Clostridiales bacterium]